jgi:hypothetical protein
MANKKFSQFSNVPPTASTFVVGYDGATNVRMTASSVGGAPNFSETAMDFKIDAGGTTILFRDFTTQATLNTHPANTIQAVANGAAIRVQFTGGQKTLVDALELATISINGVQVTQVQATAINELNALFSNVGVSGNAPTINPASIALTLGNSINYTPTGTDMVTVTYDSLPTGIVEVEGNYTLIGGSGLGVGTHDIIVRATNYHGTVLETVVVTVSATFSNTYSYKGNLGPASYFTKNAVGSENDTPFYRPIGATGPAWTIFSWTKRSSSGGGWSVVFSFGDYGTSTGGTGAGTVYLLMRTISSGNLEFSFVYGDWSGNFIKSGTVSTGVASNTWFSYQIVYDGTSTNNSLATNPFSFYINGVLKTLSWTYGGTGYAGSIEYMPLLAIPSRSLFKLGRGNAYNSEVYGPNIYFDEMALWQSDESANASTFYNAGSPIDLASYNPYQYYLFGDGTPSDISTFPTMNNRGSIGVSGDLTMINGNVGLYFSDVP